jgi:hypothetical protein
MLGVWGPARATHLESQNARAIAGISSVQAGICKGMSVYRERTASSLKNNLTPFGLTTRGGHSRRHSYSLLIFYNLRDELLTTGNYDGSAGQERGKSRRSTIHLTANNVRGSG